ncbi:LPS export ABC transporter periplasmic protein LptC [Alkalimonas sp. MEB108]|uniref:Lipopolysaccharide export system protein LptC n=1 Tax=Alkalimonas cellulosilytica TaxID=3058395 RepID=A0ABU7J623_9GAMM|nr:LPS export ABC transporter periplasmic protein LptC [Alkalimonas sp. MEB108]MEE2001817.1 LPS export ABC transporter periplasmic protein LptC [Alkalimonas sp. MEB108]
MNAWRSLLLLLGLVAVVWYWYDRSEDTSTSLTDRELIPDFVAEQLTRIVYNEQGQLSELMQAKRMEHYDLLGFTQLEKPVFTLQDRAHNLSWQASSNTAVLYPDDKLILDGAVLLQNLIKDDLIDRVQTSYLEMLLPSEQFVTDEEVQIIGDGFTISGRGLRASILQQTIEIENHIRTDYHHEP